MKMRVRGQAGQQVGLNKRIDARVKQPLRKDGCAERAHADPGELDLFTEFDCGNEDKEDKKGAPAEVVKFPRALRCRQGDDFAGQPALGPAVQEALAAPDDHRLASQFRDAFPDGIAIAQVETGGNDPGLQ